MKSPTQRVCVGLVPVIASAIAVQFAPFSTPSTQDVQTVTSHSRVHLNMRRLSLPEQVAEAGAIVRARVAAVEPFVFEELNVAAKRVTISIDETFKGGLSGTMSFTVAGGSHNGVITRMDYAPTLEVGRDAILFFNTNSNEACLMGRSDAVYPIALDSDMVPSVFGIHDVGANLADFESGLQSLVTTGAMPTLLGADQEGEQR